MKNNKNIILTKETTSGWNFLKIVILSRKLILNNFNRYVDLKLRENKLEDKMIAVFAMKTINKTSLVLGTIACVGVTFVSSMQVNKLKKKTIFR